MVKVLCVWLYMFDVVVCDFDLSKVVEYLFNLCSVYNMFYNYKEYKIKDLEGPCCDGVFLFFKVVFYVVVVGMNLFGIAQLEEL